MSVYLTRNECILYIISIFTLSVIFENGMKIFLKGFSLENVYGIILPCVTYGLFFLLKRAAIYGFVVCITLSVAKSFSYGLPSDTKKSIDTKKTISRKKNAEIKRKKNIKTYREEILNTKLKKSINTDNDHEYKDYLTESMNILSDWIYGIKAKELYTVAPRLPTEYQQNIISRLVLIELFMSYRTSRLQCLLNEIIFNKNRDTTDLMDALTTLVFLALKITPREKSQQDFLHHLVSASLLVTSRDYVCYRILEKIKPFNREEEQLMQYIGYDKRRHMYPQNQIVYRMPVYENFYNRNIYMTNPHQSYQRKPTNLSKYSYNLFKYVKDLSFGEFKLKLIAIEKSMYTASNDIRILINQVREGNELLVNNRNHDINDLDINRSKEYDIIKKIKLFRKKSLQFDSSIKEVLNNKLIEKWSNAIYEASINGVHIDLLQERADINKMNYEHLTETSREYSINNLKQEKKFSAWIFKKLNENIAKEFEKVEQVENW